MGKSNIAVKITCQGTGVEVDFDRFEKLARQICLRFSVEKATVDIEIIDDEAIRKANSEFLDSTSKTDVLSFDLSDEDDEEKHFELLVNADEALRQAQQRGHSIEAELALYMTHGLLHNLGFDDSQTSQAEKMHKMEDEILQQDGFGIVYGESN